MSSRQELFTVRFQLDQIQSVALVEHSRTIVVYWQPQADVWKSYLAFCHTRQQESHDIISVSSIRKSCVNLTNQHGVPTGDLPSVSGVLSSTFVFVCQQENHFQVIIEISSM